MRISSALAQIHTGDVLLFRRSPSLFGRLIRVWTQSPFSHVGVAIRIVVDGTQRLAILEALEGVGVRLHPLDRYLEECHRDGCKVDWYAVTDDSVDRLKVAGYALQHWGKRYASPWQFAWSWGRLAAWVRRMRGLSVDTDPERYFCSELIAGALVYAGYRPDGDLAIEPAETAPGDVALYTCLQRRGEIEP